MTDTPRWVRDNARVIAVCCAAVLVVTAVLQFTGDEESPWIPLGFMYLSSSVLGLDAAARGVRKRLGEGPSIANLAPGGWTIFAGMFWIVAVPAYYFGARRRVGRDDEPRERLTRGSWVAMAAFALLGAVLIMVGAVR